MADIAGPGIPVPLHRFERNVLKQLKFIDEHVRYILL
jgi:hypothetical protein